MKMRSIRSTKVKKINDFINRNEKLSVITMMLIACFILVYPVAYEYPLHTTTDELGAIVGAASLAGYDWSGVIDKSGYYGFGFYSLFAPLFKLHLSPIIIYRVILVMTRILRGCTISGIAYYLGKHYYKFSSKIELMLLSIICTIPLHPLNYANIINDIVLDVFSWIIILSVCKIVENLEKNSKCIKWICIYISVCFWCLFLHTRALVIIIASLIVLLGLLLYKKRILLLLAILVIPAIGLGEFLIGKYQKSIWSFSGENLRNASVSFSSVFPIIEFKTWQIWFDILLGHISVQLLLTGGLFLLAVVVSIRYCCALYHKELNEIIYISIVLAISVLSMGSTFGAFLVSNWFINLYDTWDTVQRGQAYCYKALCYVRYWNVFAMPFLFTGIYLCDRKEFQDCVKKTIWLGSLVLLGFTKIIVPIIQTNSSAGSFLFTYLTYRDEEVSADFYYKCILICLLFDFIALIFYYRRKNKKLAIFTIMLLMIIGYYQANENYNKKTTENVSDMVLSSYEQKCLLEKAGRDIGKIYAYDDRNIDSNWKIFSVLQFYFYEYRIEDEYPKSIGTNDIIITYDRIEEIEKDFPQLQCYQLDNNEVWYTNLELVDQKPIED